MRDIPLTTLSLELITAQYAVKEAGLGGVVRAVGGAFKGLAKHALPTKVTPSLLPAMTKLPIHPPGDLLQRLNTAQSANRNGWYGFHMQDKNNLMPKLIARLERQRAGVPEVAAWAQANGVKTLQRLIERGRIQMTPHAARQVHLPGDPAAFKTMWLEQAMKARHYLKDLQQ